MPKKVIAWLLHPRVLTAIGLLLLLVLVYQGGRILDSNGYTSIGTTGLLLICLSVLLGAVSVYFVGRYQAMKRSRAIEQRLHLQAKEQAASVRPDRRPEIEALEKQLRAALDALHTSRLGRGALYSLPWYIIVGPPGSGKTTLLKESGLNFPYTSQVGRGLRGVGGTRNCDWWFTDQGILLDTAGRYTTEAEDHEEWLAFLQMLRRARKRKPINGAIVAISIQDVVSASEEQREEHATKIRHRLDELTKHLAVVCPIYLVFTKCDLLDGFVPFFENMTREERAQVWGMTLPFSDPSSDRPIAEVFASECELLHRQLVARRLALFTADRPTAKAQRVFAFPLQLAAVREALADFVRRLCQPNPYHEGASLRGFYFTSGTQEGEPIDRVLMHLGEALGVKPTSASHDADLQCKSYFIDHLFTKVIFPDQGLARSSARLAQREKRLRTVALALSVVGAVGLSALMLTNYFRNGQVIAESQAVIADAERILAPRKQELLDAYQANRTDHWQTRREPDVAEKGALSALAGHFVELHRSPWGLLSKSDRIYDHCRQAYIRVLREYFLNPLEGYLRQSLNAKVDSIKTKDDIVRFQNHLAVYQIIGGKADAVDRGRLAAIIEVENLWNWRSGLIGTAVPAGVERSEKRHLDALLQDVIGYRPTPDWTVAIDESTRQRALDQSKRLDRIGSEIEKVFAERAKGKQLEHLVPAEVEKQSKATANRINESVTDAEERRLNEDRASDKVREEVLKQVREYILALKPKGFQNLKLAEDALSAPELTAADGPPLESAYRVALSKLAEFKMVEMSDGANAARVGAIDWIRQSMTIVAGLGQAITTFVGLRGVGSRIIFDVHTNAAAGLLLLTTKLEAAQRSLSTFADNADPSLQDAVRTVLVGYVESVEMGLQAEANAEARQWWDNEVGIRCKGFEDKYPFAGGGEPLPIGDFTEVFNPVNGTYSKTLAVLERLAVVPRVFALSANFKKDRQRVRLIQSVMFHGGSATPLLPFHVRLSRHEDLDNVEFALKQGNDYAVRFDSASGNINDLESVERRWTDNCREATVRTRFANSDWQALTLEPGELRVGDSPWSLFRLMATGQPVQNTTVGLPDIGKGGKVGRQWVVEGKLRDGAARGVARILLATRGEENPFAPGFFRLGFHPPVSQ